MVQSATALETYVSTVEMLTASGSLRELVELHNGETVALLTKNWSVLDNVLEILDMQKHTLSIIYVLIAKLKSLSSTNYEASQIVSLFKKFSHLCNREQASYVAHAYYELWHMFTNFIVDLPVCIQGIEILSNAIEKMQPLETQLTPLHADLCQLSLKAKYFKYARIVLDVDITTIATASETPGQSVNEANNDAKYFLLYYYYGGMIYTAIKDYERALYFFEVCISTPAMAMSQIMLEAYKKFVLVSLILHGKIKNIPKYSWQVITRFMKPLAQFYHELGSAYVTSSSAELAIVVEKYNDVYIRDQNIGLVKQVTKSLFKKNIKRLTKTFLTLSLSDVASRVQLHTPAQAEKCILDMIKSGEIFATINQKDGMVIFNDSPQQYNSSEMFVKMQNDMTKIMELIKMINEMENEIILNPVYIKKVLGSQEEDMPNAKAYASDPLD